MGALGIVAAVTTGQPGLSALAAPAGVLCHPSLNRE
jgi:hypothetical protein